MFAHLHVHSAFSLLEGTFNLPHLMFRLEDLQMPVIALTDTNAFYGAVAFYQNARQVNVKPIVGCCLQSEDGNAVLLAKNKEGYSQISEIITARHLVDHFSLRKDLKKLAYISDPQFFILSHDESLLADLATCWDHGHLYAELIRNHQPQNEKKVYQLRQLAGSLQLGVVATNDVHFLYPQDFFLHRVLTAIRLQSHIHARLPLSAEDSCLKTEAEMKQLFHDVPEAIENVERIVDQCNLNLEIGKYTFPPFPLPEGESAIRFLEKLCDEGLQKRYRDPSPIVLSRIHQELEVIQRLGFAEYFLVVWDILQYAQQHHIGWVGRGSAACSLVSYSLGITNVDPIRYDLFFERFLNPER